MALQQSASRAPFFGSTRVTKAVAFGRPVVSRAVTVNTQAFFGFGGSKPAAEGAAAQYYICIDCGYILDQGDFKKAPGSFKCPVCNSPKSRFKVYKGTVRGKPNNTGAAMKQRFQARQW